MTTTLTDRYVHAVQRSVPEARREEIGRELRSSIDDMVDARDDLDRDDAERAVLTDLGDPGVLAAQYADRPLHLIGPRYFLTYWRLMLRLLTWIPAAVALVVLTVEMIRVQDTPGAVGTAIGAGIQVALHIVFWTTLAFAVLERVDAEPDLPQWSPDDLPDAPAVPDRSVVDTTASVVFTLLLAAVLVGQSFRSWVQGPDGDDVAVFDPALWSGWLPFLVAVLVVSAAVEVWKHREGGWTAPIAIVTSVLSVAFAAPVAWLAWREALFNPEFVEAVGMSERVLGYVNDAIVAGAVVVVLIEVVDAFWSLRRRRLASA